MRQKPGGLTHAEAGVDIDAGARLVDVIRPAVRATALMPPCMARKNCASCCSTLAATIPSPHG